MFSKKNLWFLTLFSIILVMAVYYISTPLSDDALVSKEVESGDSSSLDVDSSSAISSLRVSRDESLENEVNGIKSILMDTTTSSEEKSDAYEALKELNSNKGKEEALEALIKKNFNYENFVKIDGSNVKVVVDTKEHSYELANKIMTAVQGEFEKKVYITVSFGAK